MGSLLSSNAILMNCIGTQSDSDNAILMNYNSSNKETFQDSLGSL